LSQSKSGSGAAIVAVIGLGAAYVAWGMYMQAPGDSSPMPRVPVLSPQARKSRLATDNPYIAALLAPRSSYHEIGQSKRFSELLKKKLAELDLKKNGLGSIKLGTSVLSKEQLQALSVSQKVQKAPVGAKAVDADVRGHMDRLLSESEASYEKGDMEIGLEKVKEALAYSTAQSELPATARIDILLSGSRLSYGARDFDQSRQYVSQAIALAHQNQDYKMDDLEGVRCMLSGNGAEAADYNLRLAQFNTSLNQSDFSQLPALADGLIDATKSLPEDSFFRISALLNQGSALFLSGAKPSQTRETLTKVEALAEKAHDQPIVASCEDLLGRLKND